MSGDQFADDLTVTYTLRELLQQIHDNVTRIDTRLDQKASVEYVETVELSVQNNDQRIRSLELAKARLYGAAATISVISGGVSAWLVQAFATSP